MAGGLLQGHGCWGFRIEGFRACSLGLRQGLRGVAGGAGVVAAVVTVVVAVAAAAGVVVVGVAVD